MTEAPPAARTGAESVLLGLGAAGVDYLFANAGTDFPSVIEALAALDPGLVPCPVTAPHETAAVGMAHGYWLVTGRPQAVMVHVNVGLANAAMGVINAASDNVPMLVMSGRTPITERGRKGARVTPIQYGQEMYDQTSIVRDAVKFTYEMRYPEQGAALVHRALAIAQDRARGAGLPEPSARTARGRDPGRRAAGRPARPGAEPDRARPCATEQAARWLAEARHPLILCQRGDVAGRLAGLLSRLAARTGAPSASRSRCATSWPRTIPPWRATPPRSRSAAPT
jgi:acetolactate synthase I/II/III large subunit